MKKQKLISWFKVTKRDGVSYEVNTARYYVGVYVAVNIAGRCVRQATCSSIKAANAKARKCMKQEIEAGHTVDFLEIEEWPCGYDPEKEGRK